MIDVVLGDVLHLFDGKGRIFLRTGSDFCTKSTDCLEAHDCIENLSVR